MHLVCSSTCFVCSIGGTRLGFPWASLASLCLSEASIFLLQFSATCCRPRVSEFKFYRVNRWNETATALGDSKFPALADHVTGLVRKKVHEERVCLCKLFPFDQLFKLMKKFASAIFSFVPILTKIRINSAAVCYFELDRMFVRPAYAWLRNWHRHVTTKREKQSGQVVCCAN